jgi:predicted aspartyl protease
MKRLDAMRLGLRLILLLLLGAPSAWAGPCHLVLAAVVPLHLSSNGRDLMIDARLDDRPVSLIIDTGSEFTTLSRSVVPSVAALNEDGYGHSTLQGIGGRQGALVGKVSGLRLGKLRSDIVAVVIDQKTPLPDGADGTLGMSVLGAYDLDFDLPDQQLRFFRGQGDCSHPTVLLHGNLFAVPELTDDATAPELLPRVPVVVGGRTFSAMIDTGSTATSISAGAARSLGLDEAALARDPAVKVVGFGTEGKVAARIHRFDELDIGDLGFRNALVIVDPHSFGGSFKMLLGLDFLLRAHLWLSNSSETAVFQVPSAASPPLPPGAGE